MTLDPNARVALLTPPQLPPALRAAGILSPAEHAEVERLRAARYYLALNNGPHGERLKCGRCGRMHEYFTYFCLRLPFRGLDDALRATLRVGEELEEDRDRDPAVIKELRAAYRRMEESHPLTARALQEGLDAPGGMDFFSLAIGIAEPISRALALRLEADIRALDPTFRVVDPTVQPSEARTRTLEIGRR